MVENKGVVARVAISSGPKIDGRKLLKELGLLGKEFTEVEVCDTLANLGKDKVEELLNKCAIEDKTSLVGYFPYEEDEISLKKRLKYARNPMEKAKIQRELSERNAWNGRHRKGK